MSNGSRRVHVTGGSGFLGAFVVRRLVEAGFDVTGLARSARSAQRLQELGAEPIDGDLDEQTSVEAAFRSAGASALVNIASLGFGHAGTIIDSAEAAGVQRAVFVSTTAIFTKLNAPSKAVRLAAEERIRDSALSWTIVRPTMIYGTPGDRNMWRLLRLLRRSPAIPAPGGGRNLQQPVHVEDLAIAVVSALAHDAAIGKAYDIAGPEPMTFREIVAEAGDAVDRSPRLLPVPGPPVVKLLQVIERSGRSLPLKAEQVERLLEDKAFDISDAVTDLSYSPRPFSEGIRAEAKMTVS